MHFPGEISSLYITGDVDTIIDIALRTFWKKNQFKYPTFASLARDISSISATGAGIELLFNSAWHICY